MSYLESKPRLRRESTPFMQIVLGVLASLFALLTTQTAVFLAYQDLTADRAFTSGTSLYDGQGRRITWVSGLWHQYAPLGWVILAGALLIGIASMWRAIGNRRTPTAWLLLFGIGVLASAFWLLTADRFDF